jgi:hypothetical protein
MLDSYKCKSVKVNSITFTVSKVTTLQEYVRLRGFTVNISSFFEFQLVLYFTVS